MQRTAFIFNQWGRLQLPSANRKLGASRKGGGLPRVPERGSARHKDPSIGQIRTIRRCLLTEPVIDLVAFVLSVLSSRQPGPPVSTTFPVV